MNIKKGYKIDLLFKFSQAKMNSIDILNAKIFYQLLLFQCFWNQ